MNKPNRLSWLQHIDPGTLISPFLGCLLIGAGLAALYFVGQVTTLACSREQANRPNCAMITSWMNLTELSQRPVPQLTTAYIQDSCDEDGCTYRVMLSSSFGDLPFSKIYSSGMADKQYKVDQIKVFIQDSSQTNLAISEGSGLFIIIPLIFIGVGVYLSASALANVFKQLPQ